jgi:hypothetical protein
VTSGDEAVAAAAERAKTTAARNIPVFSDLPLAHSAGYVELFYGRPLNQSSWELATDALARSKTGMLVGGAKRLYGIVEGGDLAYVEERVDADGGLVPHLSARLSRFVG